MQDILQVLVQVLKSLQPQSIPQLPDRLLAYGSNQIFDIAWNRKHCFPLKRNSESGNIYVLDLCRGTGFNRQTNKVPWCTFRPGLLPPNSPAHS